MIEVKGLTKYYGRLAAVKDVSFRIESGEIVGFLGPNGAGKTTTMRILTCFSPPSDGEVRILNMNVQDDFIKIRRQIGYLPESVPLYDWMRVESYLNFAAKAKGVPAKAQSEEIKRVALAVDIYDVRHKIIRSLSKGFRQRVGLAQALMGDPQILILDEPTIGLDPKQIREIRQLIKSFSKNRTVILSTHILPEVSQICDRVIIINKGSIVAEDTPQNLAKDRGSISKVILTVKGPGRTIADTLKSLPEISSVILRDEIDGQSSLVVETEGTVEIRPILSRKIVENGWDLMELRLIQATLEDVFIDLVTEESETDSPEEQKEAAL